MRYSIPRRASVVLLAASALVVACGSSSAPAPRAEGASPGSLTGAPLAAAAPAVEQLTYEVIRSYPHDRAAYTQGLLVADGQLYESTGLEGESSLRRVDLHTGAVQQRLDLPQEFFGEGIASVGGRLIQLTWRHGIGLVYDRKSFAKLREFRYPGEGWGLTYDGRRLIMSDGTDTIRFWHPDTFEELGRLRVRDGDRAVTQINELEYVDDALYANIFQQDLIARIDPNTGTVTAWIDMSNLLTITETSQGARMFGGYVHHPVLNGIAHDPETGHFLVTGKLWPWVFEVRFVRKS